MVTKGFSYVFQKYVEQHSNSLKEVARCCTRILVGMEDNDYGGSVTVFRGLVESGTGNLFSGAQLSLGVRCQPTKRMERLSVK